MARGQYILNDAHEAVPEPDLFKWAIWLETADRLVRRDADESSGWTVSTVFLGLDHQWGDGPPILFETMVFAPGDYHRTKPLDGALRTNEAFTKKWDGYGDRYSTWDEAVAGHQRIIERIGVDIMIERDL